MQTQALQFNQNLETAKVQQPVLLTKQERHQLALKILKKSQNKPSFFTRLKLYFSTKEKWKPTKSIGKSGVSFNHSE